MIVTTFVGIKIRALIHRIGTQNCSILVGDNICHDGTLPNLPNFDCLRFACDGGDCDSSCLDTLMEKSSHLLQTASCDFWHEEVTKKRRTGANMCGTNVVPDVNLDNDPLNNIEPSLILACKNAVSSTKGHISILLQLRDLWENYYVPPNRGIVPSGGRNSLRARYQQTTEIWDEALDGPAEIYFNPKEVVAGASYNVEGDDVWVFEGKHNCEEALCEVF